MKSVVFLCTYANEYLNAITKDERLLLLSVYVPKETSSIDQAKIWESDEQVFKELKEQRPQHIIIFGWPKLLSPRFVNQFDIINIHPSYLPSWKGPDPIGNILLNEKKFGGVTFHRIDENEDEGVELYKELFSLQGIVSRGHYLARVQSSKYVEILIEFILLNNLVISKRANRTTINIRTLKWREILGVSIAKYEQDSFLKMFRSDNYLYICVMHIIVKI